MKPTKKSKAKVAAENPWHTDFRNTELLPDIKVIRTHFFVNLITVFIPLIILVFWVLDEVQMAAIKDSISGLETQVSGKKDADEAYLALSKEFDKETAKIRAMEEFYTNLFPASDLMLALSEVMEDNMSLSRFSLAKSITKDRRKTVESWGGQMSGYVAMESEEATAVVNRFAENIRTMELFAPYISEPYEQVQIEVLSRDKTTNSLNFTIRFSLNTPERKRR